MHQVNTVKSISIWIFIIPFLAVNSCLLIVTSYSGIVPHPFLEPGVAIRSTFPYLDGGVSISRTVRYYPLSLIFKPAMFVTAFLLIKYWINMGKIVNNFDQNNKYLKRILFFGIGSAILLAIHSIFLGIKFEYDLYKLFRRVVMLSFIIFELVAQYYLIKILFKMKDKINNFIILKYLKVKKVLIHILIIVSIIVLPFLPFDNFKFLKHALEWNVFLGVIIFYLLTHLMWKKISS